MRGSTPAVAALVALAALVASCTPRAPLASQCTFNGDCAEPLVCAAGQCRAQCLTDRDCAGGFRCVASATPNTNACVPPGAPLSCAFNSQCPLGAVCAMGACRTQCTSAAECGDGGACTDGACTVALVVSDAGGVTPVTPDDAGNCPGGLAPCGAVCVDLFTDDNNCGNCGSRCAAGTRCSNSVCCAPGLSGCTDRQCHDLQTDPLNCGSCAMAILANQRCEAGRVVNINDDCAGAIPIQFAADDAPARVTYGHFGAAPSVEGCAGMQDVFYSFTLPQRQLVYLATVTEAEATDLGIVPRCGAAAARCSDRGCNSGGTPLVTILEPGTYRVVVGSSRRPDNFPASLVIQHRPITANTLNVVAQGTTMVTGTLVGAASESTCGASGPSQFFAWASCRMDAPATVRASACAASGPAPALELWNGDGLGGMCASATCTTPLAATIVPNAGLHVLFVSGTSGGFTLQTDRP